MTPALAQVKIEAGNHHFVQHLTSYHRAVYLQFRAVDLFSTELICKSHASYIRLRLGRRDTVERYVEHLEKSYEDHKILDRAQAIEHTLYL